MSIPISQFIPPPPPALPLSPLGVHTFVLYVCVSISQHASFTLTLIKGLLCAKHTWHFCPLPLFPAQKPKGKSCPSPAPNPPLSPTSLRVKAEVAIITMTCPLTSSSRTQVLSLSPSLRLFQPHWPLVFLVMVNIYIIFIILTLFKCTIQWH